MTTENNCKNVNDNILVSNTFELLKFLSYEIPKESFKYFPIYFVLKSIWIKN